MINVTISCFQTDVQDLKMSEVWGEVKNCAIMGDHVTL